MLLGAYQVLVSLVGNAVGLTVDEECGLVDEAGGWFLPG